MRPRWADAVRRMGHAPWFAAIGKRVAPRFDRAVIKLSGGRLRTSANAPLPTLLLTHTGRKSGKTRTTPLLFAQDGEQVIVAGSNWGQQHDPAWALNLVAQPRAEVRVGRRTWPVTARLTSGEERARLWEKLRTLWPAYDTYTERSGRDIKVFVLEPRDSSR